LAGKSPRDRPHTFVRDKFLRLHRPICYTSGSWFKFNGVVWETVEDYTVRQWTQDIIDSDAGLNLSVNASTLRSIVELTKVKVSLPDSAMDDKHDLLTFTDCTLEISTRQKRLHAYQDHLTSAFSFPYDPQARSDVWEKFLDEVIPPDCHSFLQEYAGYCLTTDMAHELAVWLWGPQGCGKSTFIEGLRAALGPRVTSFSIHNLEDRFGLSHLKGKTLAISTETPASIKQVQLLNQLISGEGVMVDRKYEHPYELFNRAKFLWGMNEVPKTDKVAGLDRRVVVIKFPPLLESKRDENIKRQIQMSGQAILNWMLEGLDRLSARGRFERPAESAHVLRLVNMENDDFLIN
jgi:putative DNA primase/helicase